MSQRIESGDKILQRPRKKPYRYALEGLGVTLYEQFREGTIFSFCQRYPKKQYGSIWRSCQTHLLLNFSQT